jgi:hypothetical protein
VTALLTAAATATGLAAGGWGAAAALTGASLPVLAALVWVLRSDERTQRLTRLVSAVRQPREHPAPPGCPRMGPEDEKHFAE